MDTFDAIKNVMLRIDALDPDNASTILWKIMNQDGGAEEILRLAAVPDHVLVAYINQLKSPDGACPIMIPHPNNGFRLGGGGGAKPTSYADVLSGSSSSRDEVFNGQDSIVSPSGRSDSLIYPYGEDFNNNNSGVPTPFHRRSLSVNDAAFLANFEEGVGFGWRPCVYHLRGFCKNGNSCKFIHGGEGMEIGSPSRPDSGFDELLRIKALQQHHHQQKLAFMASGVHHPLQYNKPLNFLSPGSHPRTEFSPVALRLGESSSLRQIYLTFPADSTFKEDDVFRYFSKFGPVQDVRIPYQQKRMFGFVSFFYPETVKHILAKGNPHFVCDSRVLVKPYKEKGKIQDKKHQQQHHYSDSASLSPPGIDPGDLVDLPIGPRMLYNTQEMMRRKKIEQEMELQHAIELEGQRFMNLQIMDRGNQQVDNLYLPNMFGAVHAPSPLQQPHMLMNQNTTYRDILQAAEFDHSESSSNNNSHFNHQRSSNPDSYFNNLEHTLPDNLFGSPTKSTAEHKSIFSSHAIPNDNQTIINTSNKSIDSLPSSSCLTPTSPQRSH